MKIIVYEMFVMNFIEWSKRSFSPMTVVSIVLFRWENLVFSRLLRRLVPLR